MSGSCGIDLQPLRASEASVRVYTLSVVEEVGARERRLLLSRCFQAGHLYCWNTLFFDFCFEFLLSFCGAGFFKVSIHSMLQFLGALVS